MTILKSFSTKLKTFCADASGQIALGFGLAALPMLAATGIAFDYSQYTTTKAKLQQIVDSAALAATAKYLKTGSESGLEALAQKYINENMKIAGLNGVENIVPSVKMKGDFVELKIQGSFKTTFMKLLNVNSINLTTTQAGGAQGDSKVMTQVMLPSFNEEHRGEIALVMDYSSSMTVPPTVGGGTIKWIAMRDEVNKLFNALSQNGQNPYVQYGVVPFSHRVRVNIANNLYKSNTNAAVAPVATYTGTTTTARCVRDRNYPYNRQDTTPTTTPVPAANTHASKFNVSLTTDCTTSNTPTQNVVRPLNADHAVTQTYVNALRTGSGTHIALGLEWGWHVLTSNAPYSEGVASLVSPGFDTMKAVVLLTDGEQTSDGYGSSGQSESAAVNNMLAMCTAMKAQGIRVITVAYDLNSADIIDNLEDCATTDPDTGLKWAWNPRSNAQLATAFADIRAKLVRSLYVSK